MKKIIYLTSLMVICITISSQFGPSGALIMGNIQTPDSTPLNAITIDYTGAATNSTQTDALGDYSINENLALGDVLTLTPQSPTGSCMDSDINILDLLTIRKHILNIEDITCPYALLAADVNDPGSELQGGITTFDLVLISKVITGAATDFSGNTPCYLFYDASYNFPDPNQPYPQSSTVTYDGTNVVDFIAVQMGNVTQCGTEFINPSDLRIGVDNNITTIQGNSISMPITVDNFSGVKGFQFTIEWDPTVLSFQEITSVNDQLIGFSNGHIEQMAASEGFLTIAWIADDTQAAILPDGSSLFEIAFDAVGPAGSNTAVSVNSVRTTALAINNSDELTAPLLGSGSVIVEALGGQVTGNVHFENGVALSGIDINYTNAASGTTTTINNGDYTVNESLTLGDMLTLTPISPNGDCPPECIDLYDFFLIQQHIIGNAVLQSPYQLLAADINNSQTITSLDLVQLIRFLQGFDSAWSNNTCLSFVPQDYSFPDAQNPWIEPFPDAATITYDGNNVVNFIAYRTGDVSQCTEIPVNADLEIFIDENAIVSQGDNIQIPVKANNFSQINGFQFTIEWDPAIISLNGIASTNPMLSAFSFSSIGQIEAANGYLRVIWVSDIGPITLSDDSFLFEMDFQAIGADGSSTPVSVNGARIPALGLDNTVQPIIPQTGSGSIMVMGDGGTSIELNIGSAMANIGEQVCVPITVNNFSNILGFQFSINYDPSIIQFAQVQSISSLTGFNASSIGNISPGNLSCSWSDPNAIGQSLSDGSVLFEICFMGVQGGTSSVSVSNSPTPIEFINNQGAIIPLAATSGEILIKNCPNDIVQDNAPGQCEAFINIPIPVLAGPYLIVNDYNNNLDASDTYPVGITIVTYSFFNTEMGDTTFCSFSVTVNDVEQPILDCPVVVNGIGNINSGGGNVNWIPPTAIDNCPIVDLQCTQQPGDFMPCGVTVVNCVAIDASGNSTDCSFEVIVECEEEVAPNQCGDMVVNCYSGNRTTNDPNGFVLGLLNIRDRTGINPINGDLSGSFTDYHHPSWIAANMGEIFGLTTDPIFNIYTTSTTIYPVNYFGVNPLNTGGEIYVIPANTSIPQLLSRLPNTGQGLGDVCYAEAINGQQLLFVTNWEDGKIYRINLNIHNGNPDDPANYTTFDPFAADDGSSGYALLGELLWGIAYNPHEQGLYFGRWMQNGGVVSAPNNCTSCGAFGDVDTGLGANEIHYINMDNDANFGTLSNNIITLPQAHTVNTSNGLANISNPVSDIAFSQEGRMLISERSMCCPDEVGAHNASVLEYIPLGGNTWIQDVGKIFFIGLENSPNGQNSSGGIDYGYDSFDEINPDSIPPCDSMVWATADLIPYQTYGPAGMSANGNSASDINSYLINISEAPLGIDKRMIGDLEIFKCGCPEMTNCPDLTITSTAVDTTGHDCCFTLDFDNTGITDVYAIELEALGDISLDYSLPTGYFDPNHDENSVLISPQPLGAIPNSVQGLAEICLSNVYVNPQQVVVSYWNSDYEVFCTDTLLFDCPIEPMCLDIVSDTLSCDSLGYNYNVNVQVPPGSDFNIGLIKMTVTAPPALAGDYPINFATPLQAGDQATLNFPFSSLPIYDSLDSLCFILTAHNGPSESLCCFALDTCIVFPVCDPCPQVSVQANPLDTCCYRMELTNNYLNVPGYFTQIQTTILTPDVYFSAIDYSLASGWVQNTTSTDTDIIWDFNSNVPTGVYDFFDFCVDGMTTTDSICIAVNWINREDVICTDTVKVYCPECILITEETIACNPITGEYTYTFSGENWSVDYDANTISFIEDDPNFDIQPASLSLGGTIPPYGSFGPISTTIIPTGAQAGDTLCFDMVLRNVIQDSINIECCYVTHCIVLPECDIIEPPCSCDNLTANAGCGFDIAVNCYELTFTPRCTIDDCDVITWLNANGGILGTTNGTSSFTTDVFGPGIYTFLYQVRRTDDEGNVCNSTNYGHNIDVPLCEPCPNITCIPPADINIGCADLPDDFDPNDTSSYGVLFGIPTTNDCPAFSWIENQADIDNLLDCNSGTIIRNLTVQDNFGNSSNCQQLITISANTNYAIRFPADFTGDCSDFESTGETIETIQSACDLLAVSVQPFLLDTNNPDECVRFSRIIDVINWCEWDGLSEPLVISRDENCNGIEGEEDVWVVVNNTGSYTDSDVDPTNTNPAAGIRNTSCDGQSNPAGHWRSNSTHPGLQSVGRWQYEQIVTLLQPVPIMYNITNNNPHCTNDNDNCTADVQLQIDLSGNCLYVLINSTILFYDENNDGSNEAVLELTPGGVNVISGPANVNVSGNYPVWTIDISNVPVGDHLISVQSQSDCGGDGLIPIPFEVVDCIAPSPICISNINLELLPLNPASDVDGDGDIDLAASLISATDFLAFNAFDCSGMVSYSINIVGTAVDINQQQIYMTCDEIGVVDLEIHAWDTEGNQGFCLVQLAVNDPNGTCSNLQQSNSTELQLFPNPVREQLSIQSNRIGIAETIILRTDGQATTQSIQDIIAPKQTINISQLPPGVYWLQLRYTDGEVIYKRFVKM